MNAQVMIFPGAALRALLLSWILALAAGCSDHTNKVETETHFLQECTTSCASGLSCICGVCTESCTTGDACEALSGAATCAPTPDTCGGEPASRACDVTCVDDDGCGALGNGFTCRGGRCRVDEGMGGASGGGEGGAGGGGSGGQSGGGSGGGGSGGQDGSGDDAAVGDGGPDASDDGSVIDSACNAAGEPCCDPFPGDGPNYCDDVRLVCGANNTCEANCDCVLGAYVPACGVDGQTYDATCGDACVPVEIACRGQCPCPAGYCAVACTGAAPQQEAIDACAAITDMAACTTHDTGSFPPSCRWALPGDTCPPFP